MRGSLTFYEWDPMESYGLGSDNMYGSPVDGMIANVPYLIKPAKVKASNRYIFKNIIATEKKSVENSEWSWGAISCSSDPDYVGYYWTSDDADVKFYPNYTYKPMFANGYTVEMCDTVKAFTGVFETEGAEIGTIVLLSVDEEGYLAFGDDAFDIPVQQILDLIALGQQKAGWYPGIPAAMTKKLTTVPELGTSVAEYVDATTNGIAIECSEDVPNECAVVVLSVRNSHVSVSFLHARYRAVQLEPVRQCLIVIDRSGSEVNLTSGDHEGNPNILNALELNKYSQLVSIRTRNGIYLQSTILKHAEDIVIGEAPLQNLHVSTALVVLNELNHTHVLIL